MAESKATTKISVDSLLSRDLDPLFLAPQRTHELSAWWAHVPFAFWIVSACRPRVFVELGTHNGVSYAAFCEAVLQGRLETRCYAIDTWVGDPHSQPYGEDVYENLRVFHDKRFAQFSELIRSSFDDAGTHFENGSIDLLHIDGYHTYEAVRHDFEMWRHKLSDRAVVIFHDTNVRERDFGVWRFFAEMSRQFPSFEFMHGHGLGVLSVGAAAPAAVARLCALTHPSDVSRLRERFAHLGARWSATTQQTLLIASLRTRLEGAESHARVQAELAADAERRGAEAQALAQETRAELARVVPEADRRVAEAHALAHEARARTSRVASDSDTRLREATRSLRAVHARSAANEARLQRNLHEAQTELAGVRRENEALKGSTVWRASAPLRAVVGNVPSPVRTAARWGLRTVYWMLTPWAMPRRIRFLREQSRQQPPIAVGPDSLAADGRSGLQITDVPELDAVHSQREAVPAPVVAGDRLSIVYVSGEPDTPGHEYRVVRYMEAAAANGHIVTCVRGDKLSSRIDEVVEADVLILWRVSWNTNVQVAVEAIRSQGKKIIFDVDDLMVDPDLARVQIIDGIRTQSLTEDGVREHYAAIRNTMLASDVCFAATEELGLHMRKSGKIVHVLHNGFDEATHNVSRLAARRWRRQRTDKLIRIGYACGSRTHQRDLGVAIEAIARLLQEHADCRLVLFRTPDGTTPVIDIEEYPALQSLTDRIEWRPLRPLAELPEELARFDINLVPLEFGNPFCEAKSELKFFEAALAGVPTIASPTGPYRRAIAHGRTGFLAASADDWYLYGRQLIEDTVLRDRVGRDAYLSVLARFGAVARAPRFGRVIEQLRGGVNAARAFALETQLSFRVNTPPAIPCCDTIFEQDALDQAEVTVVIPLYNYENYVIDALDSVREQTLHALDLVVVEDCSTDGSLAVATAWAEKNAARFNRILVLKNQSNCGLATCRNSGFAAADTPYVLSLDADNKLLPRCCETLLNTIHDSQASFAYGTIKRFGGENTLVSELQYAPQRFVAGNYIDAMALVSKEAWAMVGGFKRMPVTGWEDYDFWCRLAECGLRGEWHPEVLALYRVHESSMLRTVTNTAVNHRRLVEDFKARHPWVSLMAQEFLWAPPKAAVRLTPTHDLTRLHTLLPILRCPETHQKLTFNETKTTLASVDGLRTWPILEGRPVLTGEQFNPEIRPVEHLSNELPENALELIRSTAGLVLNLSAGGSAVKFDHVVEVEFAIFRHTDLVADAHELPFDDETFEAIVVMNAFEHYRDPARVAAELYRILRPGGRILIRTAFMQPLHERPWHFFNCTRYGLAEWLKDFETEVLHVSENFCPNHSLSWLASEAEATLRSDVSAAAADAFSAAPFGALAEMWRDPSRRKGPLWDSFYQLGQSSQEITAAGFEFAGRKPLKAPSRPFTGIEGIDRPSQ